MELMWRDSAYSTALAPPDTNAMAAMSTKGPEAEHHFHFAKQVQQAGMPGDAMGQPFEELGGEGMNDGEPEDRGGDDVEGFHADVT